MISVCSCLLYCVCHVGARAFVVFHPHYYYAVQCGVGASLSASLGRYRRVLPLNGFHGAGAAELSEGGLAVEALSVVAECQQ